MGEDVVGGGQVGADSARGEPFGGGAAEEGDFGRHAARDRRRRDIGRRLDSQRRHAGGEEMAQQIAVVGGDLDHHRARPELETVDHRQRVAARVRDPGIRHRREIGVVGEDRLGTDGFVDLNQKALAAHPRVQREAPLAALRDILGGDVAVGKRRLAEIDEGRRQRRAAIAAGGNGGAHWRRLDPAIGVDLVERDRARRLAEPHAPMPVGGPAIVAALDSRLRQPSAAWAREASTDRLCISIGFGLGSRSNSGSAPSASSIARVSSATVTGCSASGPKLSARCPQWSARST